MNLAEIRALKTKEIRAKVDDLKEELFNLRFQLVAGQLQDVSRPKRVKRDLARLLTILRERELAAELVKKEEHHG
jgi:large subunit ribosomal protein L29